MFVYVRYLFVYLFIYLFIYLLFNLFIYLFIHSFVLILTVANDSQMPRHRVSDAPTLSICLF